MVRAALAHARENGWLVTVAVVDDGGAPIMIARLDDASPASFSTAIEKARSAAFTGLSSKLLESMIGERPALVTLGRVSIQGGLPILHEGQRVGGIGVSGVRSDQDEAVATSGLAALAALHSSSTRQSKS
jgi:glc operon protein GlcG